MDLQQNWQMGLCDCAIPNMLKICIEFSLVTRLMRMVKVIELSISKIEGFGTIKIEFKFS